MAFLLSLSPFKVFSGSAAAAEGSLSLPDTSTQSQSPGGPTERDIVRDNSAITRRSGRRPMTREEPSPSPDSASHTGCEWIETPSTQIPAVLTADLAQTEQASDATDEGLELVDHEWKSGSRRIDFFSLLPREIVSLILLSLPSHHSLLGLGLVSKVCRELASDPVVWKHFFHRNVGWRLRDDEEWLEELLSSLEDPPCLVTPPAPTGLQDLTSLRRDLLPDRPSSPTPSLSRLDWKRLYVLRYRLASRWGDVAGRSGRPQDPAMRAWNEDFSGSEEEGSSRGSQDTETSDEEIAFRRGVEEEAHLARAPRVRHRAEFTTRRLRVGAAASRPTFAPDIRIMDSHEDNVYCVKTCLPPRNFAPSLGYIVTGSRDATIRVWSIETGRCTHVLRHGHSRSILALDIDPEGRIMVSCSSDQKLGIWSWFGCEEAAEAARQGRSWKPQLIDRWNCHSTVMDVRLSERYLVLGLKHGQVRCYRRCTPSVSAHGSADTVDGIRLFERLSITQSYTCSVNDLKIRGDFAAAGYANGELEVIHIPSGAIRHRLPKQRGVACMDFHDDLLVCGSSDLNIYCFRPSTGALLATLKGHTGLPRSLQLAFDKALLVSVGYDGVVNLWDLTSLLPTETIRTCALGTSWQAHGWRLYQREIYTKRSPLGTLGKGEQDGGKTAAAGQDRRCSTATGGAIDTKPRTLSPRFSSRDYAPRSSDALNDDDDHQLRTRRPVRLFDVAFDGKRLVTVGEMRSVVVREFLTQADRTWIGWELFA
ncbi:unnamed protein product [Parajaminaea phylloscopi]